MKVSTTQVLITISKGGNVIVDASRGVAELMKITKAAKKAGTHVTITNAEIILAESSGKGGSGMGTIGLASLAIAAPGQVTFDFSLDL